MSSHPPARARYFSLVDADRTLPLVRRIVADIHEEYRDLQPVLRELRNSKPSPATEVLRRDVERRSERLNGYLDELMAIGCHFKDFDLGLVDFFSRLEGRPVHLCWKLGEPRIDYWHELDAGFAGRRRIDPQTRPAFEGE